MKILLIGEYSRLHNSLKEGLEFLGHDITLIATGDYFKDYPADIKLNRKFETGFGKKIKVGLYRLFRIDISSISIKRQFFSYQHKLKDYDVVQLINESPFGVTPKVECQIISFLKQNNKKLFLLSCGADNISVKYALSSKLKYSILDAYKNGSVSKKEFDFALKYITDPFLKLHEFVFEHITGVIASDLDYHLPLNEHPKYLGLIPNPVISDRLNFIENPISDRIIIFLGINRNNYYTKGIKYFEKALELIEKKYSENVHIEIVENLPYLEYIEKYNNAHIVLDQVLSYDQGYNALEAMSKGKVVFTGAEKEFMDHYQLEEPVAINVLPNTEQIFNKLEDLIQHPEKIIEIGKNASEFVKKEHHYMMIAKKYLEVWKTN